eukprot:95544-Rhodomonas_salina.2
MCKKIQRESIWGVGAGQCKGGGDGAVDAHDEDDDDEGVELRPDVVEEAYTARGGSLYLAGGGSSFGGGG